MIEAIFAGAVLAIVLAWIARSMKDKNGFVRNSSRSIFMRDLNERMGGKVPTRRESSK